MILETRKKSIERISCLKNNFGDMVTKHSKISNILNYHFSKLGEYIGKHCDLSYVSIPKTTQSFSFRFITTMETPKLLNSVTVRKSIGPSDIPPRALKDRSAGIAKYLTFNAFIAKSKFPSQFKQANVTPIFRKGHSEDQQNHRPISRTSVLSKLFEKISANQINAYLNRFDLISHISSASDQKSEQQMLWSLAPNLVRVKWIKTFVDLALLDFSKAFNFSNATFWRKNILIRLS